MAVWDLAPATLAAAVGEALDLAAGTRVESPTAWVLSARPSAGLRPPADSAARKREQRADLPVDDPTAGVGREQLGRDPPRRRPRVGVAVKVVVDPGKRPIGRETLDARQLPGTAGIPRADLIGGGVGETDDRQRGKPSAGASSRLALSCQAVARRARSGPPVRRAPPADPRETRRLPPRSTGASSRHPVPDRPGRASRRYPATTATSRSSLSRKGEWPP
jgi:hypothetical protein